MRLQTMVALAWFGVILCACFLIVVAVALLR